MSTFPETIPDLIEWRASRSPDRPWLSFENDSWTLADVLEEVDRIAVGLAERGVKRGDRVALLFGNRPETLFTWFATNRLGAAAVMLNTAYKSPELAGILRVTTPRVLVLGDEHRALASAAVGDLHSSSPLLATPEALASAGRGAPRADVGPDDVAVLLATSGTTGAPKAVAQTHRTYTLTAEAFPFWVGLGEEDRLLTSLPLFHVNAQAYSTMGSLGAGARLALLRRFSASTFWEDVRRTGATQFNAVGAMLHILLAGEPKPSDRDHAVRTVYAALALPEAQHRAFEERFGVSLMVGYGLSESTFGTVWPRGERPRYGSMGVLRQHPRLGDINRARVVGDDGSDAPVGGVGELWLANPAIMRGYFESEAETEAVLRGGWLRTGDLVTRDADGFYTFVARKKEVLRRRGENVAAAEIENVLCSHPAVLEAAAIGVPSALGEDEIVAYVAPRPGATIDVAALRAFAVERLADFKVPSEIHVRASLPRTATERIAKHLLRNGS